LFNLYVRLYNVVLLYSVENRDGYWQNFFARNSKLRPENGGTGNRTQTASRSRSGVISGQDSSAAAAAVPPSRSMSASALPPVPVDEKTTVVRNDYVSNEDASSANITAGRRLANFLTVFKKVEKASSMLCTRSLCPQITKKNGFANRKSANLRTFRKCDTLRICNLRT
jgi:hypothetical protein